MKFWDSEIVSLQDKSGELNLFRLAIPIFFQLISATLLSMISSAVLASISSEAVAAVNIAASMVNLPTVILTMPATGAMILMSLALGMKDYKRCGNIYIAGLWTTIAASVVFGIIGLFFAADIIGFMKPEENLVHGAVIYFKVRIVFLVFGTLTTYITSILNVYGNTKSTFISAVVGNVTNLILSLLIVNDVLGFSDKVLGMAVACVMGQLFSLIYAMFKIYSNKNVVNRGEFLPKQLSDIMRVGVPGGITSVSYVAMHVIISKMITSLGTDMLNTNVFFGTISNFTYQFGAAIAQAGGIMTGRLCGNGNIGQMKKLYGQNVRLATFSNVVLTLIVFIFSNQLMRIFTDNETIIASVRVLFLLDIAQEFFRGITNVTESALNGMEDTAYTSAVSIATNIVIKLLLCQLTMNLGMGLNGFMLCGAVCEGLRALILRYRFRNGKAVRNFLEKQK